MIHDSFFACWIHVSLKSSASNIFFCCCYTEELHARTRVMYTQTSPVSLKARSLSCVEALAFAFFFLFLSSPPQKGGGKDRLIDGDGCRQRRRQAQTDRLAHASLSRNTHRNVAEISNIVHLDVTVLTKTALLLLYCCFTAHRNFAEISNVLHLGSHPYCFFTAALLLLYYTPEFRGDL